MGVAVEVVDGSVGEVEQDKEQEEVEAVMQLPFSEPLSLSVETTVERMEGVHPWQGMNPHPIGRHPMGVEVRMGWL
jgi:hypothetical protein